MKMPNGYGTISKLKGKRRNPWIVRTGCKYEIENGSVKEKRAVLGYYPTKADAIAALAQYNQAPYDLSKKATFADIYYLWVSRKQGVSQKSLEAYNQGFNKCESIHDMAIADIRLQHLQAIADKYSGQSKSFLNQISIVFNGIFGYAMKYDLIAKDYSRFVEFNAAAPRDIRKVYTDAEIQALWNMPAEPVRDITLILLYSGWRANELLTMTGDNINLIDNIFTGGMKTEAGKNRAVPIHHRILPLVSKYKNGFPLTYAQLYHGLKRTSHTVHDTRHSFISRMQSAGADHICLERIVGHASKSITDKVYTHKDIEELRQNIELLP